jgi:Flp pilus assembly protein TadD
MRVFAKATNTIVCLSQALMLVLPLPSLAASGSSGADIAQIDQYEKVVFGKTKSGQSEESRLDALEQNIFGEARKGKTRDRLKALGVVMGTKPGVVKLQRLTPMLDTSHEHGTVNTAAGGTNLPPPSPAPSYDGGGSYSGDNAYGASGGNTANRQDDTTYGDGKSEATKNLLRQAIGQYQSGNTAVAEKTFRQVLQQDPGNSDAHFSLGAIAEGRGDFEGADQHYHAALQKSPDDSEIQQAVTALEAKMKERKQQQETQQQVAQQEQQHAQLKRLSDQAAAAYRVGKYDEAIADLEQVARQAPNDPDVQYALAQAYRGKGDMEKARFHIGQALAQNPNNQMYRAVQTSIEQEANSHSSRQQQQPVASGGGYGSPYRNGQMQEANGTTDDGGPAGQITPIQPEANAPHRTQYGYANSSGGMGGMGGMGGLGGLLPGMVGMGLGYGMSSHRGYGSNGSTRIKRAVEGSLAGAASGAAMAAMFNHQPGAVKQGAMKGALFGGLAGLIFGGF